MKENTTNLFIQRFSLLMKLGKPRLYGSFTKGEMRILTYLYQQEEPVQPGELCQILDASSARVAAVLKRLESKGQIERRMDTDDRRKIFVCITPAGHRLVENRRGEMHDYIAEIIDRLGEDDAREGLRILAKILDIAEQMEFASGDTAADGQERKLHG